MAKVAHLNCTGYIYSDQSEFAADYGVVSLTRLKNEYAEQQGEDTESITVHIHSCGGEVNEGYAIHDWLKTLGKPVNTIIEGDCKSIATVVCLAGTSRQMTSNAEFMIHNPWGFGMGNAGEMQEYTDVLKDAEEKLLNFYVEKTGGDKEKISALMNEEKNISADDAKTLGFITEVVNTMKAMAQVRPTSKSDNSKQFQNMENTIINSLNKKFDGLMAFIKGEKILNASVKTSGDETLYYEGDLAVGTAIFTDEAMTTKAPDKDYTLSDGRVITVAEGKVSAIKEAPTGTDEPAATDPVALKAKVDALTLENAENKKLLKEQSDSIQAMNEKFEQLNGVIRSTYKPAARVPLVDGKVKAQGGTGNSMQDAADRRKADREKKESKQ